MRFKGAIRREAFRTARRADRVVPERLPRPVGGAGPLEIRVWRRTAGAETLLLATASRRQDGAVGRNRFRRRARHALARVLAEGAGPAGPVVVWIRPAREIREAGRIPFQDLLGRLRLALQTAGGA